MTRDQRFLVQTIFAHWRQHYSWPTIRYMIGVLKRERGADLEEVMKGIPERMIMGQFPGQDSEPMRLAVRALPLCSGADFIIKAFLALHREAAVEFVAHPLDGPRVGAAELRALLPQAEDKEFEALSTLVFEEFIGGSSTGDMKSWRKEVDYPILPYAKVTRLTQWLKLRDTRWEETGELRKPHVMLLQAAYRQWRQKGAWPNYRTLLVENRYRGNIVRTFKEIPKSHFARLRADGPPGNQREWMELTFEGIAATGQADDDLLALARTSAMLHKHFISPDSEKPLYATAIANQLQLDRAAMDRLQYMVRDCLHQNVLGEGDNWHIVPSRHVRLFEDVKNADDFFKVLHPDWEEWRKEVLRVPQRHVANPDLEDIRVLHLASVNAFGRQQVASRKVPKGAERLGPYLLTERLGEGANGTVWRASDAYGREQAIKIFKSTLSGADKRTLSRELSIAASLDHPSLVRYLSGALEEVEGKQFIRMELIRGTSLRDRCNWQLSRCKPQPIAEVIAFLRSVMEPLQALHAKRVVHRDLHAGNVLLTSAGKVMLVDYGSARRVTTNEGNSTFKVPGSLSHAAPEKWDGPSQVGPSSDYFSLGVVLYLIATGRLPFWAQSLGRLHVQIAEEDPVDPRRVRKDLPKWLGKLILRLLDRSPKSRLQSPNVISKVIKLADRDPEGGEKLLWNS